MKSCAPKKILVVITRSSRLHVPSVIPLRMAAPMFLSARPPPYASALSKKLTPFSNASFIISYQESAVCLSLTSIQLPSESLETSSPEFPRKR
ncbi:hypothetical protein PF005_g33143 [Phytophthora fragariae]|uniref:Uncharacterized protein n=1 Tax=Phytophthora fragariae TaxID=53985 RepID=A0A6A3UYC0_9STRA|nr:hypothetical protein PF009_g32976 [Phytophthora fragariae]KAE9054500.1 hypothetical protein PF007_g32615 [Phytophthora fragariae]KAE9156609.1 hypothetical protein PF005_g33143 [Phytophthora fragariae]KAE9265836.1 hypothetical protein PF001_g30723 [Phytophthora fragariae]